MKKYKILFIHVGKTGGSSIKNIFNLIKNKLMVCHLKKPSKENLEKADFIIISTRDPIKRFISAFNYAHEVINYDVYKLNFYRDKINVSNCIAPYHLKQKKKKGYAFNKNYNQLINYFENPNKLAESLTDPINTIKAYKLMNNNTEHIYKSIGYYTDNGKIIEKYFNKIIVVSVENFDQDINNLLKKLYGEKVCDEKIICNKKLKYNYKQDVILSKLAIENLYHFYKETDYKSLKLMYQHNLIPKDLYEKYISTPLNI